MRFKSSKPTLTFHVIYLCCCRPRQDLIRVERPVTESDNKTWANQHAAQAFEVILPSLFFFWHHKSQQSWKMQDIPSIVTIYKIKHFGILLVCNTNCLAASFLFKIHSIEWPRGTQHPVSQRATTNIKFLILSKVLRKLGFSPVSQAFSRVLLKAVPNCTSNCYPWKCVRTTARF